MTVTSTPAEMRCTAVACRNSRRQCSPDRHARLDIALIAQSDDGIALDRADFHQVFEEPVNDAGAMQERGCRPANG